MLLADRVKKPLIDAVRSLEHASEDLKAGAAALEGWDNTVSATPTSRSTSSVPPRASTPSPHGSSLSVNRSSSRRRNPTIAARSRSACRSAGSSVA